MKHLFVILVAMIGLTATTGVFWSVQGQGTPDLTDLNGWEATASDDVSASLSGDNTGILHLDFNFNGVAGYAVARRDISPDLPENFALRFKIRGDAPANDLQIKFVDKSGDNVWWYRLPLYQLSAEWQQITIYKDDISFAWGPVQDTVFHGFAVMEIVIAAGHGGQGWLAIDTMEIVSLPVDTKRIIAKTADPDSALMAQAMQAPRGMYPRAFHGEQNYWTLVGDDGGRLSALLSEDGAFEVTKGSFSIEPFIEYGTHRFTWADVTIGHSLMEDYLPIPSVHWTHEDWRLTVTAFTHADQVMALYRLQNTTDKPIEVQLFLDIRPLQVNPPTQFLNTKGGVSPITDISVQKGGIRVNGKTMLWPSPPMLAPDLSSTHILQPGETTTIGLSALGTSPLSLSEMEDALEVTAQDWREKLNRVHFSGPDTSRTVFNTLRSTLAQILMSRDGFILQPGTRSYNRSWIRDGAMMGEALLRLGHGDVTTGYMKWYAQHQFSSGKIPCCVDWRGADPVPENDSDGEFIFLAREVFRYGGDMVLLKDIWPRIQHAFTHMESLRAQERTPATLPHLYGLMPPSISHEGYSAKPAYSYWDNFWALRGYKDAAHLAFVLGDEKSAREMVQARDEFHTDLLASITHSAKIHNINYIPGAADLGDFDATSTTIALAPGGEFSRLPGTLLDATFKRYWQSFLDRRDGRSEWDAYTPYELRTIGAFIRLGWREEALELLNFFMHDRRPASWNQWAEVVGRDQREPRFVGDMPHGWIASDYIRAVLDMFVYEDELQQSLIIGAGVPMDWLRAEGLNIENLYTPYGVLNISAQDKGTHIALQLSGTATPPGGFIIRLPQTHETHTGKLPFGLTLEKTS